MKNKNKTQLFHWTLYTNLLTLSIEVGKHLQEEQVALVRDGVWEEMVRQAWRDYVNTVNRETTLQRTNTENSKQIFPEKELRGHSPNFHIHVSLSDLYIPTIDLPILLQEIRGPILGTQTHECGNWD